MNMRTYLKWEESPPSTDVLIRAGLDPNDYEFHPHWKLGAKWNEVGELGVKGEQYGLVVRLDDCPRDARFDHPVVLAGIEALLRALAEWQSPAAGDQGHMTGTARR